MWRRLSINSSISNIILIYYSIFLIVNSLILVFFKDIYNKNISDFSSIVISVVLLVYSLINSKAAYIQRIEKTQEVINKLKSLKRRIKNKDIMDIKNRYDEIANNAEVRSDLDFFRTIKQLCKKKNISWRKIPTDSDYEKIRDYLSEINPYLLNIKVILIFIIHIIIFILPVIVLILCFLV